MKHIYFIFLFILPFFGNSQNNNITIATLEKLTIMNSSEFESFALSNGFQFIEFNTVLGEFKEAVYHKKDNKSGLVMYQTFDGSSTGVIAYHTSSETKYMSLKKELLPLGLKFEKTKQGDNGIMHYYANDKYTITLETATSNYIFQYSVTLTKL